MSAFEEVSANLLSRERLPGLSEMTTLTLVHAVQRPLARPQFLPGADGLRFVRILEKDNRSWGAHIGAIDPRAVRDSRNIPDQAEGSAAYAVGAFNIHRASTGQATMDGGWYDHGAPEALRQVRGEWQHRPVFRSLSLDVPEIPRRDDGPDASCIDMLRDDSGALRRTKVRIDTGDAAPDMIARRVAVQLTATSRFVPYFPETRPRLDFALSSVANGGGQDAVKVALQQPKPQSTSAIASFLMPATRRPERPQISEETLIRQFILDPDDGGKTLRASFRVIRRLYLGKKWFTSGEGELLVMLLLPGDQFGICSATNSAKSKVSQTNDSIESLIEQQRAEPWMKPYITQWGGDVTMKSSPLDTDLPQANFIKGWSIQCGGLALPSLDGPSPAPKPEYKGRNVSILGFTPKLDAQRGEWYCDIEVDASLAYTAMVRLGLAAYQPNAIVGQELSLPVGLEPYPLQPRWDVMVQRSVNVMEIQVTGAGYKERAPSVLGLTGGDTAEIAQQVLERTQTPNLQFRLCHADTGIQVVENGEPVIDVKLTPNSSSGGRPMWIGKLPIPTSEQGRPLRVHVSEVITHANAEVAIEGSGANPLVTLPTSFAFDTTMPAI